MHQQLLVLASLEPPKGAEERHDLSECLRQQGGWEEEPHLSEDYCEQHCKEENEQREGIGSEDALQQELELWRNYIMAADHRWNRMLDRMHVALHRPASSL